MEQIKIPVWIAILININIVIGSAFFLNAQKISSQSGIFAPFAWLICGLLLLPLVFVLSSLARHYPTAGGLYVYSFNKLGPLWGFISGWGYFIGTIAANAAVIHAFSKTFQKIPIIKSLLFNTFFSGIYIDIFLILLFMFLNLLDIKFLEGAQIGLACIKAIPLLLILFAFPLLFDIQNITTAKVDLTGLIETLPLVLFAYIGMEACCAIADKIPNGQKNAARVIFISFGSVVTIYAILQLALLCIHGSKLSNPFLEILPMLTNNNFIINWGNRIIYSAILSSFLGSFYGMFYYNNWNLFAIAEGKHIIGHSVLTKLSKRQVPWVCVLIQAFITILLIIIVPKKLYLITMSDFGTVLAYLLSALSFLAITRTLTGFLALASCSLLIFICTKNLLFSGLAYVIPFIMILVLGIIAHKISASQKTSN